MPSPARHKVVIIGCGNVAWHITKRLKELKSFSVSVYNHKANPALRRFSAQLNCSVFTKLDKIEPDADYYFICVGDQFISTVSKKIHCDKPGAIIIHTSGSMECKEIKNSHANKGVFYPLQSFSSSDTIDWKEVPLVLESSSSSRKILEALAKQMSGRFVFLNYKERLRIHLCAVLVNNFTNALYTAAWDQLQGKKARNNFDLLLPLIRKTAAKVETLEPRDAQTGPAKRKDKKVKQKHLDLLKDDTQLEKLYKDISQLIVNQQNHA